MTEIMLRVNGDTEWISKYNTLWMREMVVKYYTIEYAKRKPMTVNSNFIDGTIDYAGQYFPPTYDNCTITVNLLNYGIFSNHYMRTFLQYFHGKVIDISFEKGKRWYTGLCHVKEDNNLEQFREFNLEIDADPFVHIEDATTSHIVSCSGTDDNLLYNGTGHSLQYDSSSASSFSVTNSSSPSAEYTVKGALGTQVNLHFSVTAGKTYRFFAQCTNCRYKIVDSIGNEYGIEFTPTESMVYLQILPNGPKSIPAVLYHAALFEGAAQIVYTGDAPAEITFPEAQDAAVICLNNDVFAFPSNRAEPYSVYTRSNINRLTIYTPTISNNVNAVIQFDERKFL